jgi:MFS family permease
MIDNVLASAAVTPSAWGNLIFGMMLLAVAGAAALLAAVPIVLARRRRLRAAGAITAIAVVWGMLLAGDVGYGIARTQADDASNKEQLMSNYVDPADLQPPPVWPWVTAAAGGVFYAAMLGFIQTRPV